MFKLLLFLMIFQVVHSQRRIQKGLVPTSNKPYVVYILKAPLSPKKYEDWLCGGALVTRDFVITSAACVEDVNYMYVIAGYNKYSPDLDDECIAKTKKKVIFTCVPVSYNFNSRLLEKWSYIDIAMVKVESPYNFSDPIYSTICTHKPGIIPINFEARYQMAKVDAMVFGWGHTQKWRMHGDTTNYNSPVLLYTSVSILDKEECKQQYNDYPNMTYIIENFMICSLESGKLNDDGEPIAPDNRFVKECSENGNADKNRGKLWALNPDQPCPDENNDNRDPTLEHVDETRREADNVSYVDYNDTPYDVIKKAAQRRDWGSLRRNGICQNDHGGPLVTWMGTQEVLIGVASVFRIDDKQTCIGPFLYTSTHCNGAFIDCVLSSQRSLHIKQRPTSRTLCDSAPSVKGFDTNENHISWNDHPDGPAENEHQQTLATSAIKEYTIVRESYTMSEPYEQQFTNEQLFQPAERYPTYDVPENNRYTQEKKFARIGPENEGILLRPQRPLNT